MRSSERATPLGKSIQRLPKLTVRVRFPSSAPKDYPAHLFAIAVIAFGLGLYGYQVRRGHRPGWPPHHAIGMSGSYIALLTGFYVDNGPFLPLWNHLPHWTYWATAEPRRRAAHLARAPPLHTINIRQANTRARQRVVVGPRRLPLVRLLR
jgi:hypothetical protein